MARRTNHDFERAHEPDEATRLAAVLLDDGQFEVVEGWTAVDEVVAMEAPEVDLQSGHFVMVPADHYDLMIGAVELQGLSFQELDEKDHIRVKKGTVVLEPEELRGMIAKAKLDTFYAVMRFVWWNSCNLWAAMRNLLAITHKTAPQFIKGMSGTDIGKLLGVCRAAFNKHEITLVVHYLKRWGVKGGTAGGSKPAGHAELKSKQMKGRRHRAADYVPDAPPDHEPPPMTPEKKKNADALWHAHERQRLGLDEEAAPACPQVTERQRLEALADELLSKSGDTRTLKKKAS